jgi:hypothetical protein
VPTKYGMRNREIVIKIFKILKDSNFCNPLPSLQERENRLSVKVLVPVLVSKFLRSRRHKHAGSRHGLSDFILHPT